ncbi:MAG TPA: hypothetical protein DIC52_07650 [Candidatus Latescibacteria bacterium]|nr:hypothetical protein [Candidatus Latescibacterota bacterium]
MSTIRLLEYQLSCIGGLEDVAVDELQAEFGARIRGLRVERGEVGGLYFRTEASPRRLLALTCPTAVEAIAAQAHDVTVGQPGLQRILHCLRGLPVEAIRRLASACDPTVDVSIVDLRITLRGAHRFTATEIEAGARPILQSQGFHITGAGQHQPPLRLSIRVRKRRVLITVHLGERRPVGDPQREGWSGPALNSVCRVLDLDQDLPVATMPATRGRTDLAIAATIVAAHSSRLPVTSGTLPVFLLVADLDGAGIAEQLHEAVRIVTPGGILGLLVRRSEQFVALLRELELPLDVMATIPYYVRRRRCVLFLLERLNLVGIESI